MTSKEQLLGLLRIQELALEIRSAQKVIDAAPAKIEQIEARFRERNAEYVAVRGRHDELEADRRQRSGELAQLEERRKKYMDDLMQVKTQKEYAAMLKEIDAVKTQISDHEEAILKDMEEIEKLAEDLGNREAHIQSEREAVAAEHAAVEAEAEAARAVAAERTREREEIEHRLPVMLQRTLRQLEATRQGIFLSRADDGTCQRCFVRVRPQVLQEIKTAGTLHTCGSCKRFLYVESALRRPSERGGEAEALHG